MTNVDRLNQIAHSLAGVPERTVGAAELQPVDDSFEGLARKMMLQVYDYLYDTSGEPPVPSSAIVQRDAYSIGEENQRDYFVYELTHALDVDVDEALNAFEIAHHDSDRGDAVQLEPWMLRSLGMEAGEPITAQAPGITVRLARLNQERQNPLTLREIELPTIVTDNETGESMERVARFMWLTTD